MPLKIIDITITGGGFHLLGKGGTLVPGVTAFVAEVAFTPTSVGAVAGNLSVFTSAGTLVAALTATGVAPTATLTPANYDFGNVTVGGSSGPVKFQLTNTSTVPLKISDISITRLAHEGAEKS